jgi:hypothetical protein
VPGRRGPAAFASHLQTQMSSHKPASCFYAWIITSPSKIKFPKLCFHWCGMDSWTPVQFGSRKLLLVLASTVNLGFRSRRDPMTIYISFLAKWLCWRGPAFLLLHMEYLIRHEPRRKQWVRQFFYCCVCIHCRGNVFIVLLLSNNRGGGYTDSKVFS